MHPKNPDFHFKISGFLAAIKLADTSGFANSRPKAIAGDNGHGLNWCLMIGMCVRCSQVLEWT